MQATLQKKCDENQIYRYSSQKIIETIINTLFDSTLFSSHNKDQSDITR